jgi:large subunit ribosomal protein L25
MEIVALNVRKRTGLGKGESGRIRSRGGIPGIFYGPRQESAIPIEVESREFAKKVDVLEGSHLIQLDSDAAELKQKMVLLREVQRHPVTHRVLHTDFYEVDLTKKLEVTVPLHFVGKAAGTVDGGILQPIVREVTVLCLPTEIPQFIDIDVTPLGIHDSIHIEDVTLPAGIEVVYDDNFTVVTVAPPSVEEVPTAAPVEGVPAEAGAEGEAAPAAEGAAPAAEGAKKSEE